MNPFVVSSALLFESFHEAFREHDRIFRDLRSRHQQPILRASAQNDSRTQQRSDISISTRHSICPGRSYLPSAGACDGGRRSFTLAREGIQPLRSSRALDGIRSEKGSSIKPSEVVEEVEEPVHLGYNWFQVSRKYNGILTMKGTRTYVDNNENVK